MKRLVALAVIIILTFFFTAWGFGQPPPFKEAVVSIDAGHVKGNKDAKLVMIEFSEYQ